MFEWQRPPETPYEKEYRLRARKRKAVIEILQKWYERMVDGTADLFEPDLSNLEAVTFKKPIWIIIARIEQGFINELTGNERFWDPLTETPRFTELSGGAKLCLCQELRNALNQCNIG